MIDPSNVTNYSLDEAGLQEVILWWILAAGKSGTTSSRCLELFLSSWRSSIKEVPFDTVKKVDAKSSLALEMKKCGIGCYNNKARSWKALVHSNIDLKRCTLGDLEAIPGIGPKTARCFLIHSRRDQSYAGLDTHLLKFLRLVGYDAPKSTPTKKKYTHLEKEFLGLVKKSGRTVAQFDLIIWNYYSKNSTASSGEKDMMGLLSSIGVNPTSVLQ
jgi:endonuclease III